MAKTTNLKIITPDGIFYDEPVEIVTVKTTEGELGILSGTSPIVSSLEISDLFINSKKSGKQCAIAGGIMYVTPKKVTIITDAIEYKDKIDLARAERAKHNAEEALKIAADAAEALSQKIALQKAINRISVKKGIY